MNNIYTLIIIIILISIYCIVILNKEGYIDRFLNKHTGEYYFNIESYIISMDEEKYLRAKHNLEKWTPGIELKKFDAIRGSEIQNMTDIVTIKGFFDTEISKNRRGSHELGSRGAIGCYLSHLMLWTQLADSDKDGYLIFESDAVCKENILKYIKDMPENCDILLFGSLFSNNDANAEIIGPSKNYTRIKTRFVLMHAYYITKKGAKRCKEYAFPIEEQIDAYLSDLLYISLKKDSFIPELFFYNVNICSQRNYYGTTIQTKQIVCENH